MLCEDDNVDFYEERVYQSVSEEPTFGLIKGECRGKYGGGGIALKAVEILKNNMLKIKIQ